jgi:hypothetical protein
MKLTWKKLKYILPVLIAIACFGLQQARADFIFTLNTANIAVPGPYAQVDVHLVDSTTATITFTSLTNSGNIYLFAGQGSSAVAVNVNATTWALSPTIGGLNAGTGFDLPGPFEDGGSGNMDGFGSFNEGISSFDGFAHSSDLISFTLNNLTGTWASANSVLTGNNKGNLAAAHIFVTALPANASNGASVTGFATGNGESVPDGGATVMLLGTALGALGMARRYLKS